MIHLQQVILIHNTGYTCNHSQPHEFSGIKDITGNLFKLNINMEHHIQVHMVTQDHCHSLSLTRRASWPTT